MIVVVNDANILIDLVKLQLLSQFFSLPLIFYSTDLILEELYDEQVELLQEYIDNQRLIVLSLTSEDIEEIAKLQVQKRQLSDKDCSAIVCAKKVNGQIITSDNTLRKFASEKNLHVCGHLWVLDLMVTEGKLTGLTAIGKLRELCDDINPRLSLPNRECEKKIAHWKSIMK